MKLDLLALTDRGTRLSLRAISALGGSKLMDSPARRERVGKGLRGGSRQLFRAVDAVSVRMFPPVRATGDPARTPVRPGRGPFDLTPTEDQEMLLKVVSDLSTDLIRPAGKQADVDREVPAEVRSAAAEIGLGLLGVPEEAGGIAEERSAVTGALVTEKLAYGDMGIAAALLSAGSVANAIGYYGDASQQATYLPAFTEDTPARASLAFQEPGVLVDPLRPATQARREGDTLIVNGEKSLVLGADAASLFIITVSVDGEPRMLIVEAGAAGIEIADDPAMGIRAARTGRVRFTEVSVPAGNLLGTGEDVRDAIARSRLAWAAAAVGTGQAALDHVKTYVKDRHAFGEPIAYRQSVAFLVSNIAIELDGLRLVTWKAAARLDAGTDASQEVALARSLTTRYGAQIGSDAVQLLGGHGFVKEHDNERWYRDLRGAGLLDGGLLI